MTVSNNDTIDEALKVLVETGLLTKTDDGRYKLTANGQRYAIASNPKVKRDKVS